MSCVTCVAAKCIDHYTKLKVANDEAAGDTGTVVDPRLEAIVNRMFQRCDTATIHESFNKDLKPIHGI